MSLLENNASRVAITTYMWTVSNQKKGYMAVTAHYIDASWILQSRIMREYHEKLVATNEEGIGDSTSTRSTFTSENVSQYDLFISTKNRKRVDSLKSVLEHYLDDDVMQKIDGFDLLNWWKVNELKYPNLQHMAQDFLTITASTVASESAFSSSGRLVSPYRNRLHPKTIEALMCGQSWLWAAEM
ncbi:zinc finger BED domain-containing protein RICESLEEPER 1-like [Apium graveolens]|uniref:zinc finger BED domain-containing protein RICESLEEPER 1-like n=1 Tax=Apium graveolens TaxID=4045 RepID=UPI003D79221A